MNKIGNIVYHIQYLPLEIVNQNNAITCGVCYIVFVSVETICEFPYCVIMINYICCLMWSDPTVTVVYWKRECCWSHNDSERYSKATPGSAQGTKQYAVLRISGMQGKWHNSDTISSPQSSFRNKPTGVEW